MNYKQLMHITLDGTLYSKRDILKQVVPESSTHASLTLNFLKEWFSDSTEIEVQTSGSTGTPKLITIPKQSFVESAKSTCDFLGLSPKTNALLCIPVTYIGGKMMVIRALVAGYNLLIQEPSSSPLSNLESDIDFIALTPMQAQLSLDEFPDKLKFINQIIIGGGAVTPSFILAIEEFTNQFYSTYGMTETVSHIALKTINGSKKSDYFEVLPSYSVSTNSENCLIINCPTLSHKKIVTNDVVELNANGFKWLGRKDNVINSGGIKIFPEEIERKLKHTLKRVDFYVTSKKDKVLGEKVILVIKTPVDRKKIMDSFSLLNKYEVPKELILQADFTYTKTGKLMRKKF